MPCLVRLLDVYKRQVGGSIMKIFGFRYESVGKIILFFLIFAIVGFPMEVFAPVSYTHLDVYKRQLYESGEATIYHATKPQSCNWYAGTGTGDLFI